MWWGEAGGWEGGGKRMGGKGGVGMCTAGGSVQLREGERVEGDLRVPFSQMNHWYDNHLTGVLSTKLFVERVFQECLTYDGEVVST